ncbi:molybdopterin-guanine dinucleotide biosynthesis protein A [Microbulbifer donghaiensis]|uniref:Molybdopterin-guanine dinucleotide biosynthesis protein A n=1 Tax=Microbulbifer donghaiensis TaxID=494016 RepID=A0A1M4YPR1_9GAMM|nr:molybdenum cofactor guanylyltransferase [Microbulbifer donghaiensis]SHF07829.1 molybdopterin-guanine dinucleotide biosynthesis protein A [Microbulbifer donghaiensis]
MSRQWQGCGVVLAGGRSSRMGRDKAQLPLPGGERFLEHAVGLMRELPLAQVLVSGDRPGGIADPIPGMGPLGGLHGVARAVEADALLVMPVDMPLLRGELLALLLAEGERSGRACYFGDFYFPLWLPLTSSVREFLRAAVEGRGPNSIGALLRHAGARQLAMPARAQSFSNINTPAEYAANYPQQLFPESD